jgi:hypothetical protein
MQLPATTATDHGDQEYRAIEQALLESARGRWFLAEHGRRARRLDSALLEDAIGRLQTSLRQPPATLGLLQTEINELKNQLLAVRAELLAKRPLHSADNDPVQSQAILKAAEDIHEVAWSLQANPFDPSGLEQIARNAGKLYTLSQSQAIESARALGFADRLDEAVRRLDAMLETVTHEMQDDAAR